jgi:hypothetical protein
LTHVYLDASALVKRFRPEIGSDIVNDTIDRVLTHDPRRVFVSSLTTVETIQAHHIHTIVVRYAATSG